MVHLLLLYYTAASRRRQVAVVHIQAEQATAVAAAVANCQNAGPCVARRFVHAASTRHVGSQLVLAPRRTHCSVGGFSGHSRPSIFTVPSSSRLAPNTLYSVGGFSGHNLHIVFTVPSSSRLATRLLLLFFGYSLLA